MVFAGFSVFSLAGAVATGVAGLVSGCVSGLGVELAVILVMLVLAFCGLFDIVLLSLIWRTFYGGPPLVAGHLIKKVCYQTVNSIVAWKMQIWKTFLKKCDIMALHWGFAKW